MRVYFTTVIRKVPAQKGGGLVALDWNSRKPLFQIPVHAEKPDIDHANPRGGARGGRGIIVRSDHILAASYHTLYQFSHLGEPLGRIDNNLFVGLHEVSPEADHIWTAATGIDAAIAVDANGKTTDSWWPRETTSLQKKFGLTPKGIDRDADNRILWIEEKTGKDPSHTHLNAVCHHDGEVYALLNRFGTVWATRADRPVIEDPNLDAPHNLVHHDGRWLINNSRNQSVMIYNGDGTLDRQINLIDYPAIAEIIANAKNQDLTAKALFVRGLDVDHNGNLWVGFSPATIAVFNLNTAELVDLFQFSDDARACIHGLRLDPNH